MNEPSKTPLTDAVVQAIPTFTFMLSKDEKIAFAGTLSILIEHAKALELRLSEAQLEVQQAEASELLASQNAARIDARVERSPVLWVRMRNGEVDWGENCVGPDKDVADCYEPGDGYTAIPLYAHPAPASSSQVDVLDNDTSRLNQLEAMLAACPHARITFNDDVDREDDDGDVPLGYSIRIDGCEPLCVFAPTLREALDAVNAHPDRDGENPIPSVTPKKQMLDGIGPWTRADLIELADNLTACHISAFLAGETIKPREAAQTRQFIYKTCIEAHQLIDEILDPSPVEPGGPRP